jgi:hypothetical protein
MSAFVVMSIASSCVKEGPMGPAGPAGTDGKDGVDANQTCKACHNPTKVDLIATQFQFSKHDYGEAAFEESGNTGCTPCHAQEAFKYVVANNVPATFTLNPTTNKWVNNYVTAANSAYGEIGCSTCHSSIHTTYGSSDMIFTTVAPVSMTMWGGNKTIDLKADGGVSNLCVKCHQPRPFTNALTGDVQDYVAIAADPAGIMYDGDPAGKTNKVKPSYRMHTHYGTAGAVYAGMGGVEFAGTEAYKNSAHTDVASCVDCHMGEMNGRAGGHTFSAAGNFKGCNVTGCHSDAITSTTTNFWVNPRTEIKKLLDDLAAKLTIGGVDIMNRNGDGESNLWIGLTTNNYDGYLNVYDPITNPSVQTYNKSSFKYVGTPPKTWSQAQKDYNETLPILTLTNAQFGAIINFQLCLRDYSLGIHNYKYTKALLVNSIAKL